MLAFKPANGEECDANVLNRRSDRSSAADIQAITATVAAGANARVPG
jgi:hypothetical protein